MAPNAVGRMLARIYEAFSESLDHMPEFAKVRVVTGTVVSQKGMDAMMEVIVPLSVKTVSAYVGRANDAGIVKITFRHYVNPSIQLLRALVHSQRQFVEKMARGKVENAVNSVYSQGINVKLAHPVNSVVDEELPNLIAMRAVKINCGPPRRSVSFREIRSEIGQVVALRAEVVVNHIQDHGQPAAGGTHRQAFSALASLRRNSGPHTGKLRHNPSFGCRETEQPASIRWPSHPGPSGGPSGGQ